MARRTVQNWRPVNEPPAKNGRYLVKFYFPFRHPTDRIELAYRDFIDGHWVPPYFTCPSEGSELTAWCEETEADEDDR